MFLDPLLKNPSLQTDLICIFFCFMHENIHLESGPTDDRFMHKVLIICIKYQFSALWSPAEGLKTCNYSLYFVQNMQKNMHLPHFIYAIHTSDLFHGIIYFYQNTRLPL